MINLPNQRIPYKEKDDVFRKACVDALCAHVNMMNRDWPRIAENYSIVNSDLDEKEWNAICSTLSIDRGDARKYAEKYNICSTIVQALLGEEYNRTWSYNIVNENREEYNRIIADKENLYSQVCDDFLKIEGERWQKTKQAQEAAEQGDITQREADKQKKEAATTAEKRVKALVDGFTKKMEFSSRETAKEMMMKNLMSMLINKDNYKFLKNRCFEDAVICSREFVEVHKPSPFELPTLRRLNPLNVYFHKSPNTPYIHESDAAGYKELMTYAQVLKKYNLSDEDFDQLRNTDYYGYGVNMDKPNSMQNLAQSGLYPSVNTIPGSWAGEEFADMKLPTAGSGQSAHMSGLYGNQHQDYMNSYYTVYTNYWISQAKIGVLKHKDDYGETVTEFVSEDFVVPKDAKKNTIKSIFSKAGSTIYSWIEEGIIYKLEWIWAPELWSGTRINGKVYVNVGPVEYAYKSLLNPFDVKLPIYGAIFQSTNANTFGYVDALRPWQKLYYAIMTRLVKLLEKDHGNLTFLNMLYIDTEIGLEKSLELGEETGIIPYNPLSNTKEIGALVNNMKIADNINLTNSASIDHYMKLLQFIEAKAISATGMSPQRIAATKTDSNVTDNVNETQHSMNITEGFFMQHDILWEHILQGLMECVITDLRNDDISSLYRGFLSANQYAIIDMKDLDFQDNFKFKVGNDSKSTRILKQMQANAQALIQNGVSFNSLIKLLRTEDLTEFEAELKEIEAQAKADKQAEQEQAKEIEMQKIQAQKDMVEDTQMGELDKVFLKGKLEQEQEHIRGQYQVKSFNMEADLNANNIPDVMEYNLKSGDLIKRAEQRDKELSLKEQDLALKQQQKETEHALKQEEAQRRAELEEKKIASKEAIEKMKQQIALKKASTK